MFNHFSSKVIRFLSRDDGPTAVEYAILLGLIVIAVSSSVGYIGTQVRTTHEEIGTSLNEAMNQ